jgi:hypothetical protein
MIGPTRVSWKIPDAYRAGRSTQPPQPEVVRRKTPAARSTAAGDSSSDSYSRWSEPGLESLLPRVTLVPEGPSFPYRALGQAR